MRKRLNSKKIYFRRSTELSKTEADRALNEKSPDYMKKQRLSDEEIEILQKKIKQWEIDHSWKCSVCGKLNQDYDIVCTCCGNKKNIVNNK